jgi:hypothetical protein
MPNETEVTREPEQAVVPAIYESKFRCSQQINEIVGALAKAQGVINNPRKEAENPAFKRGSAVSKYADLSMGINAIREGLSANNLAVIQSTRMQGDVLMLDTRLAHSSGQWFEAEYPVCKLPAPPHAIGSALTYARRYSLFGIVGIAGEDDDGDAANEAQTPAPELISSEQYDRLMKGIEMTKTDVPEFCKLYKVSALADLTVVQYPNALALLSQKAKRMKEQPGGFDGPTAAD